MRAAPTEQQIEQIRRSFKRCRAGTADAIIDLQRSGDPALIPTIVRGIVWRYVNKNVQPILEQATPETPLTSLGIDSLTMMEIVLDVQDALDLVIEDADLRRMHTIGDVIEFLQERFAQVHQDVCRQGSHRSIGKL
jgi:3-hydroxyacyl-[acyl-carrier-protein] dehydratase